MHRTTNSHFLALLTLLFLAFSLPAQVSVDSLKTEYLDRPLGLDEPEPRFSWQLLADGADRGIYQQAYRIRVLDPAGTQVWDSGRRADGHSLNIV